MGEIPGKHPRAASDSGGVLPDIHLRAGGDHLLRRLHEGARELSLVVTETYFFREPDALKVVVEQLLPPVVRARRRARVWSAACASGEEPLTLAMLLDEAGMLADVDIVASDVSLRGFEHARTVGWGGRSMRALPAGATGRWLERDGDNARVGPRLIDAISWKRVNLLEDATVRSLGSPAPRARVVAEVPTHRAAHLWTSSPDAQATAWQAFRDAGANFVVADSLPPGVPGWTRVPGTGFSYRRLPEEKTN